MSTTDKKKPTSSPKHSIKEHHDEKTDNNNREKTSNIDEIPIEEVHTANDWEHADLGDDQRKQKFLRLMGVKKRKDESRTDTKDSHDITHDDTLSSEKKHCRSNIQTETINLELEKQFNEGLQSKILHTHHEGLGFHGNETSPTSNSDDMHNQQTKTNFVPATTTARLSTSLSETVTKESEKFKDKSNGKEKPNS